MSEYRTTVDEGVYLLLSAVAENANKLGIPWLVVGATARELLLEKVYGLPAGRATVDIDFGVMVEKWERYEALVRAICDDVRFYRDSKQTQRIRSTESGYIDLIPFGEIESAGNVVRWSPEEDFAMSVAGFREAYESAVTMLVNELPVRVVSAPALVLLKLIAWDDRHERQPRKDSPDIAYVLRHNETLLGIATLFDSYPEAMEAADYDVELAAARVLGKQVQAIASPTTAERLQGLVERELDVATDSILVREIASSLGAVSEEHALALLRQLYTGLTD